MHSRQVVTSALKTFSPFMACSDEELDQISEIAILAEYPALAALFHHGDNDNKDFYLLDGELLLSARDGQGYSLNAGSDRARQAISRLRPRQYSATTQTNSKIIVIDNQLYEELKKPNKTHSEPTYQVSECNSTDDLASEDMESVEVFFLFRAFKQEFLKGRWSLPEKNEVSDAALAAIKGNDLSDNLSTQVCKNQMIDRALIHVANSDLYYDGSPCTQGIQAIERIGLNAYYLALGLSARYLFVEHGHSSQNSSESDQNLFQVWQQTVDVAAIVWMLSSLTGIESPVRAMGLALLHNVGEPLARGFIQAHPDYATEVKECSQIKAEFAAKIGELIIDSWNVDADTGSVVSLLPYYASNWHYVAKGSKVGFGDLLQVAKYLQVLSSTEKSLPEITQLASFGRLVLFENRLQNPEVLQEEIMATLDKVRRIMGENLRLV